jgi:hypothetical protein
MSPRSQKRDLGYPAGPSTPLRFAPHERGGCASSYPTHSPKRRRMDGARDWLREKMIRDGFIAGRNSHARVGLLLMNGAVGLLRIPPIRQKDGEWMGHGG